MEQLILLHGATGAASQLEALAGNLKDKYQVHNLNFSGHGGRGDTGESFSMKLFAEDVLKYMDEKGLTQVSIFGYSMGGYVAMYLARNNSERVNKVITLATKYHWDEPTAAKEVQMLNPEKIEQKVPVFAEKLKAMHEPNDWKQLLGKTAEMLSGLGKDNTLKPDDYPNINTPALVLLGDRDKMVTLDETLAIYKALPNGKLGVLPGTPHPIEQVDVKLLSFLITNFLG